MGRIIACLVVGWLICSFAEADYEYEIDFESVSPDRLQPKASIVARKGDEEFAFEAGKWYRVWLQFDAKAGPDGKRGIYSVFVKPADGTDGFRPEHAVVARAVFRDLQHDSWGRLMLPRGHSPKCLVEFRIDNFALWQGLDRHLPVTKSAAD